MGKATDKSGGLFVKRIAGEAGGATMRLSWDEIHSKAVAFSKRWEDSHREKADAQPFITEFLEVFGVDDAVKKGEREKPVKISGSHDKYIDFFWKDHIAIEMKSRDKDRAKSGESVRKRKLEGAYEQLKWYMEHIPDEDVPDLWMVCDFETFKLWRRSTSETFTFTLKDFRKHIRRFADVAGYTAERMRDEQVEINVRGAGKMAILHDALKERGYEGHELEVYLVRLLFCLFAGDAGIFPSDKFFQYLYRSKEDGSDLSEQIGKLFEVLDMSPETRDKRTLLPDELKQFRYINGKASSENRRYIPIGYMDKDTISSDLNRIVPNANRYHFGVLTSCVHMAWTRSVCGRLKSDYRYSGAIVYNNFPWPGATKEQEAIIEKLAQDILAARMLYPDSTLADMYGENSMPFHPELAKAHQALDRAVMKLYDFPKDITEPAIVAALMERYKQLIRV